MAAILKEALPHPTAQYFTDIAISSGLGHGGFEKNLVLVLLLKGLLAYNDPQLTAISLNEGKLSQKLQDLKVETFVIKESKSNYITYNQLSKTKHAATYSTQ